MLLIETVIFYLVFGAAVAVAVFLCTPAASHSEMGVRLASALLFWPLFVPVLLASAGGKASALETAPGDDPRPHDALDAAIAQVETELDAALGGLDGWAEDVLNSEAQRLAELRGAWKVQADRIRQLDRLLAQGTMTADALEHVAADDERARHSDKVRRDNLRQLSTLRQQMHADLVGTLAWVRELVTMIHLAKFSGAPAARAEELVAQIAAAVQGLSEVSSWRQQDDLSYPRAPQPQAMTRRGASLAGSTSSPE